MSQTKAQLVTPLAAAGVVTATSMTVSGVLTATTYDGNITGAAVSIAQGNNLNVGVLTASGISGDITGSATSITQGNNVTFGSLTASRLWGNLEGNAVGNALGDALSATVTGVTTSNNISVGVVTATNFLGDGTNLTGTLGNQVTPQYVGFTSAATTIDLSNGNLVYADQTASTTVSFANTSNGYVYLIRKKDVTETARTITWPTGIGWSGGSAPTLDSDGKSVDIIKLVTRDEGVTWDARLVYNNDAVYNAYVWGGNANGVQGRNNQDGSWPYQHQLSSPTQVSGRWKNIDQNKLPGNRAYGVKNDGTLWSWGNNGYAELGHNNTTQYSSPVQIGTASSWSKVFAANYGALALKTDGELWGWGWQSNAGPGWLGQNDAINYSSPVQIPGDWGDANIHMGAFTAFAVKSNGSLWAWGNNQWGQLGLNATWPSVPGYRSSPTQIGTDTTWNAVAGCFRDTVLATKTDNTLWVWGYNSSGELGLNDRTSRSSPTQVPGSWALPGDSMDCGNGRATLAIKSNGTLWAWGNDHKGQLGLNTAASPNMEQPGNISSPTQVGTDTTWLKVKTGGYNNPYASTSAAIKTDGTLWTWGPNKLNNNVGLLGLNLPNQDYGDRSSPCQVGTATNWAHVEASNAMFGFTS